MEQQEMLYNKAGKIIAKTYNIPNDYLPYERFVDFEWVGSKYKPARIDNCWLEEQKYKPVFTPSFDVEVIEFLDFGREALVVRKDVLFGILPIVYKIMLKLAFLFRRIKAMFLLRMQAYGLAYTPEGSWHSWKDLGKKPPEYDKNIAKETIKMWKKRGR